MSTSIDPTYEVVRRLAAVEDTCELCGGVGGQKVPVYVDGELVDAEDEGCSGCEGTGTASNLVITCSEHLCMVVTKIVDRGRDVYVYRPNV